MLIEEVDLIDDADPVVCFLLNCSEHVHECVGFPSSEAVQGNTPQESYINCVTWINDTVNSLEDFTSAYYCHSRGKPPIGTPINNIQGILHSLRNHFPLIFQKVSSDFVGAITAAFQKSQWQTECEQAQISLGTIVIACKASPSSNYLVCEPRPVGPFLCYHGV